MDKIAKTYKSMLSSHRSEGQIEADDRLSRQWYTTATQPWSEYMKTVHGNASEWHKMQSADTKENEESRQRVSEYIKKYKHLF